MSLTDEQRLERIARALSVGAVALVRSAERMEHSSDDPYTLVDAKLVRRRISGLLVAAAEELKMIEKGEPKPLEADPIKVWLEMTEEVIRQTKEIDTNEHS